MAINILKELEALREAQGYWQGLREGVERYAWWKDGKQHCGSCGDTLKEAYAKIDKLEAKVMTKNDRITLVVNRIRAIVMACKQREQFDSDLKKRGETRVIEQCRCYACDILGGCGCGDEFLKLLRGEDAKS